MKSTKTSKTLTKKTTTNKTKTNKTARKYETLEVYTTSPVVLTNKVGKPKIHFVL